MNYWLVIAHLVSTIIFCVLLSRVNGQNFLVGNDTTHPENGYQLSQPTMSTIISTCLTIVRGFAGMWIGLTGWRMAFITLERAGASLQDVNWMINYRIAPLHRASSTQPGWLYGALWMIFFLSLPTQFASPILTNSIKWIPSWSSREYGQTASLPQPGVTSLAWSDHNTYKHNRYYEVIAALGLSTYTSPALFESKSSPDGRYCTPFRVQYPALRSIPVHSTLKQITMPYFQIHSLEWATSIDDIQSDYERLDILVNKTDDYLTFSNMTGISGNAFIQGTDTARLILDNDIAWGPANKSGGEFEYPPAVIRNKERWVVVSTEYSDNNHPITQAPALTPDFGLLSGLYQPCSGNNCHVFARINYTAGTFNCQKCAIILDGVVESAPICTPPNSTTEVVPDPLVDLALAMIPEVLFFMVIANSTRAPTWDNLDAYTRGMITTAYQASWNLLVQHFSTNVSTPPATIPYATAQQTLRAEINFTMALIWFILNITTTLSAGILGLIQAKSTGKVIRNQVMTALLLDSTAVIANDETGLCNATKLSDKDKSLGLHLRIRSGSKQYLHPVLVAEEKVMASSHYKPVPCEENPRVW